MAIGLDLKYIFISSLKWSLKSKALFIPARPKLISKYSALCLGVTLIFWLSCMMGLVGLFTKKHNVVKESSRDIMNITVMEPVTIYEILVPFLFELFVS